MHYNIYYYLIIDFTIPTQIFDENNKWIDTKPHHIVEEELNKNITTEEINNNEEIALKGNLTYVDYDDTENK